MAFVDIPKDLTKVKPKALLGLTKKQLKGFSVATLLGGVTFFTTRIAIGNTFALVLLMVVSIPFILYGIYEPTGLTVEQYLEAMFTFLFVARGIRPYETENIYKIISEKAKKGRSESSESYANKNTSTKANRGKQQSHSEARGRVKTAQK